MLAWVVIYRRHLGQSRKPHLPGALGAKGAIRPFRISLPRSSFNIPTCKPSNIPTFGFPYLLPSSVSRKPFVCHSYENTGGVGVFFPVWDASASRRFNAPALSFAPKSLSFNLFADPHPLNLYPTIFYKNSGGGGHRLFPTSNLHSSQFPLLVVSCG
jgi:hypothetical protein